MNLVICEKCGSVTNEGISACPVCYGNLTLIGLTEEDAENKYQNQISKSNMPIVTRNECIRYDYFNKIKKSENNIQLNYKKYNSKNLLCPKCNSSMIFTINNTNKHICRSCKNRWEV